jgi:hypothetical protein
MNGEVWRDGVRMGRGWCLWACGRDVYILGICRVWVAFLGGLGGAGGRIRWQLYFVARGWIYFHKR